MSSGLTEFARDLGFFHPLCGVACGLAMTAAVLGVAYHVARIDRLETNVRWHERELERQRQATDDLRRELDELKAKQK